jgi:hypothetical protein
MKPIHLIAPLLLLAACGSKGREPAEREAPLANGAQATQADLVECAPAGAAAFERTCRYQEERDESGLVVVLRAPDGSFRRLRVTGDGRGVIAADGAEAAKVVILNGGLIEVTVGRDRYRLPATVRAPAS